CRHGSTVRRNPDTECQDSIRLRVGEDCPPPVRQPVAVGTVDHVNSTRVVVVSDTHLSSRTPERRANWDAVVQHVEATRPAFVVHLGDLSVDGANDARDLDFARARLDELPVAWHAIPGNHDVGDNPVDGYAGEHVIGDTRRDRWRAVMGDGRWSLALDGWTFIAVNAKLFGSGLAAEQEQWDWLAHELARRADCERTAFLTHKPLTTGEVELATAPVYRFVPP